MGNIAAPTSEFGTVDITTIGFEPEIVFGFYMLQIAGTADDKGGHLRSSYGIAVNQGGITQRSIGFQFRNGVDTSDCRTNLSELYMCRTVANTGANYEMALSAGSFDSSGFTITAQDGARSDTDFYWLALKLDGATSVSLSTHTTKNGTTGELADTAPGFKPQALLFGTTMAEAVDTIDTGQTIGGSLGVGMADEDNIYSASGASEGGVGTTNTETLSDNSINIQNQDGSAGVEAAIPGGGIFQANGFTLDYTAVETNAKKWFVLAIEEEAGGTGVDDSQPAYVTGTATTSDSQSAYIAGGLTATDSQSAYVVSEGAPVTDAQPAYTEGLTYMPFSEPWTGSNEDEWRRSHWEVDAG